MKAWQPEMSQHLLQPMTHGTKVPNMTKPSLILTLSARKSTRLRDLEKKKTFSFLVYHHAHKAITLGRSISESLRIAKDLFDIVLEPMSSGTRCTWAQYSTRPSLQDSTLRPLPPWQHDVQVAKLVRRNFPYGNGEKNIATKGLPEVS